MRSVISTFGRGGVPTVFWGGDAARGVATSPPRDTADALIPMGDWCAGVASDTGE